MQNSRFRNAKSKLSFFLRIIFTERGLSSQAITRFFTAKEKRVYQNLEFRYTLFYSILLEVF
ncbi:hypothetical protein BWX39_00415 [Prevotella intermedia ATCC 25611 = DSM 20706]|uniref:Uncharacterized protein n=1 Tax=Prevotella intermedia TaxID=28131 RepID=A0A2G8I9K8_PREIN|nr:hypothetical protein BWX39_00415 [Prevotella intermedia ATCC 25611 = DSM 20706]PIK20175.1 hypothetical protein CTI18_01890 [Prevotella intermedia]SUB95731.1 Uncharacterised protein [Prevotella intermedia]